MFKNFLTVSARVLWRQKTYTAINIAGLAFGLSCFLLIFLWVRDELKVDQFHNDIENLYAVVQEKDFEANNDRKQLNMPANWAPLLAESIPEIVAVSRLSLDFSPDVVVARDQVSLTQKGIYVDSTFLSMFSFPLLQGNPANALDAPSKLVLSDELATKLFGEDEALGKTVTIRRVEGEEDYQVTGIVRVPRQSSVRFDFIASFQDLQKRHPWVNKWGSHSVSILAKTQPGVSPSVIDEKIGSMDRTDVGAFSRAFQLTLFPFKDLYLKSGDITKWEIISQGAIEYVYLFSLVAIFILGMACINYVNLATSRASLRTSEVGIRKTLGANKDSLVAQFILESTIIVALSFLLATIFTALLLPYFSNLVGKTILIPFQEIDFLIGTMLALLVTVVFSSIYPSFILSSFSPINAFKKGYTPLTKASNLRKALVVFQFTISIVLILVTFTIHDQVKFIQDRNLGFTKENIISFPLNEQLTRHFEAFRNDLKKLPFVEEVTSASDSPVEITGVSSDLHWQGKSESDDKWFSLCMVGDDFIETFGMEIVKGRAFSPLNVGDSNNYIINQKALEYIGLQDPIGEPLHFWRGKGKLIGVVKDFHHHSMHKPIEPMVIMLWPQQASTVFARLTGDDFKKELAAVEEVYNSYQTGQPFVPKFIDDSYQMLYEKELLMGVLVDYFCFLAIVISCLGLIGLTAYSTERRFKEISIRKVFGASIGQLFTLLSKGYLRLTGFAILVALPIAHYLLSQWLDNFAYRIDLDWILLVLISLSIIPITLLTVSHQMLKVAKINPAESLKNE